MSPAEARDLRRLAPQVPGAVVRRYGHFDTAEDAVQEALLAAATQWPAEGIPGNPRGWLITAAMARGPHAGLDLLRHDSRQDDHLPQPFLVAMMRSPAPTRLPNHAARRSEAEPHWYSSDSS